jgi:hypothetical protein
MILNPEKGPLLPCPGAEIGPSGYPKCVCAQYLTWDF